LSEPKRIAITPGEPAGIGPDLVLTLAQQKHQAQIIALADPALLAERAELLGLPIKLIEVDMLAPRKSAEAGELYVMPHHLKAPVVAGQLDKQNSLYVLETLQTALEGCLSHEFDAVVTTPVHKGIINDAGAAFTGHTEFFADGAGVDKVVMMLATESLKVALATTHLPLREVADAINRDELSQVIEIIHQSMQQHFGLVNPRIAVCGLNPHAGEDGHLGREEVDIIQPVIDAYIKAGYAVSGAWPADTIFNQDKLLNYDVVLAMFHDQGLPVLKHHGFGKAVNVTLGLPFIRTSVDHGTALDLAASGQANPSSLYAALSMAIRMANTH
jgi:4-hydroxythreonine-4-phosphate dehydrogenase